MLLIVFIVYFLIYSYKHYIITNNPLKNPTNTKYRAIAMATNKGTYFIPESMSPFCIIDSISDANIAIIPSASTEKSWKSAMFTSISLSSKGMSICVFSSAGATVAVTPISMFSRFSANANNSGLMTVTIAPMNIVNISVFADISSLSIFVFLKVSIVSSSTDATSPPLSSCPNNISIVLFIDGESYFSENSFSASWSPDPVITFFDTKPISSARTPNSGFIADHNDFSKDSPPFRFVDTKTR